MDIGSGDGEVRFDGELRFRGLVIHEHDMRGDDVIGDLFEMLDLGGGMLVNRCGETEIAGTEMDLHDEKGAWGSDDIRFAAPFRVPLREHFGRDLAGLDLAAAAPKYIGVEHGNSDAFQVTIDG